MGAPISVMSYSIAGVWEIIFYSKSRQKVNGYWNAKECDLIWKEWPGTICIDRTVILMDNVDCCHWYSWLTLTCKWIAAMSSCGVDGMIGCDWCMIRWGLNIDALSSDHVFWHWSMVECYECADVRHRNMYMFRAELGSRSWEHSEMCRRLCF